MLFCWHLFLKGAVYEDRSLYFFLPGYFEAKDPSRSPPGWFSSWGGLDWLLLLGGLGVRDSRVLGLQDVERVFRT